jgi:hypothetical protein
MQQSSAMPANAPAIMFCPNDRGCGDTFGADAILESQCEL